MKWKLTVAMSTLMAAISILMAAGMYSYMKKDYLASINSNRLLVVSNLATSAFEALLREDISTIIFLGEQFGRHPDVISVMVLDQDDRVAYDSRHMLEGSQFKGAQERPASKRIIVDGREAEEITVPFKAGESRLATARVVYSMVSVNNAIAATFKIILLFAILGILVGVVISSIFARWITLPMEELTRGMNAIEDGNLDYRISISSHDELERVGNEFNFMAERLKEVQNKLIQRGEELKVANQGLLDRERDLASKNVELQGLNSRLQSLVSDLEESNKKLNKAQDELLEKEKMAAILELAGAAAHEMNQPLTIIIGNIDLLLSYEGIEDEKVKTALATINKSAREMAAIVKKMSKIKRYETGDYIGKIKILDLDKSSRE